MSSRFDACIDVLRAAPRRWLITGVAGFIGSHLLETLLSAGQNVVGVDDFSTGHQRNLTEVRDKSRSGDWNRFQVVAGDIRDFDFCRKSMAGVNHVLHQAAIGSVPRSITDPLVSHSANQTGFLNMLCAAKEADVRSFVYASSSSVYGDQPESPKCEHRIGSPLSPYAVTKLANELYAEVFAGCYGFPSIGLRYFNVFGPRQDPDSGYAAVIPKWIGAMVRQEDVIINGDGETTRDFCFVANAVQANLLAATAPAGASHQTYNVAVGDRTSLNILFAKLTKLLDQHQMPYRKPPTYGKFRDGDVRHSQADIGKAGQLLGYEPTHNIDRGLAETMSWYIDLFKARGLPDVRLGNHG